MKYAQSGFSTILRLWFLPIILGSFWVLMFIFIALPSDFINIIFSPSFNSSEIIIGKFFDTENVKLSLYVVLCLSIVIDMFILSLALEKNLFNRMFTGTNIPVFLSLIVITFLFTIMQNISSEDLTLKKHNEIITTCTFIMFMLTATMIKAATFVRWSEYKRPKNNASNINALSTTMNAENNKTNNIIK